jgi:hypothetical protein
MRANTCFTSTMSIFLYQFWLFGFTTAKNWGRGPRAWNAINLGFLDWQSSSQDLAARSVDSRESGAHDGTEIFLVSHDVRATDIATPYQFCRWSRHPEYELVEYQARAPASELHNVMKTAQKSSGSELKGEHWPESWKAPPFEERLKGNLERSDFCSINPSKVPLSMPAVVQAVKESPNELLEEAIGFSIMGRNASLLYDLLRKAKKTNLVSSNLNPFHLATSYLDGSKTCCLILDILFHHAPDEWKKEIRIRNSNDLGHTLLDTLMITILRNHTSVSPDTLDNALKRGHIFPGQETDICGRWDADSRCYQQLLLSGKHAIPSTWKHKFCHTSAQAVCHSIAVMHFGVDLEAPSGLFLKHCSYCGAKLQLSSLHTLVMTSFYLATAGCENEDLFGAIACLLNLLACEVDPRETSKISLSILLGSHERYNCSHDDLTPVEFAEALARESVEEWPDVTKTGWQILCHILRIAEEIHDDFPLDFDSQSESGDAMENDLYESEENSIVPGFSLSCSHHNGYEPMEPKPFGQNRILGHLWAAAQTELLTHRRQCEEDPWTSEKFDLPCVLKRLKERTKPTIPLVKGSMMKPYCACGFFEGCFSTVPPTRRKACPACVSNMIRYSRQTWIDEEILWK